MPYLYMGTIVPLSVVIPLAAGIAKYKILNPPLKIIFWFLIVNGFSNIIAKLLSIGKLTNLPVSHLYTAVEFTFLCFFYRILLKDTVFKKQMPVIIIVFLILSLLNSCFFQSIYTYNSYTRSLEALLMILLAIAYFMKRLEQLDQLTGSNSLTIINSAILLYFSGAFILFIISNVIVTNVALGTAIWNVHATLVLILYLLFATALWMFKV